LGSNTSEGKAYNLAFTLAKNFRSEFIDGSISGTYSYESLQYYLMQHLLKIVHNGIIRRSVNGSNALSRSDFDQGRRIISNGNATLKWNKFTKTRIGVFEGAQGTPISYVYNDNVRLCKIHSLTRH
jgi:hypothetical protein